MVETVATIDNVPIETLSFIFKHLTKVSDLQNAILVCPKWESIITQCSETMNIFRINLTKDLWRDEKDEIVASNRFYVNVELGDVFFSSNEFQSNEFSHLHEFLHNNREHIREVNFSYEFFNSTGFLYVPVDRIQRGLEHFVRIIDLLPNLRKIACASIDSSVAVKLLDEWDQPRVQYKPSLKEAFLEASMPILNLFDNRQFTKIVTKTFARPEPLNQVNLLEFAFHGTFAYCFLEYYFLEPTDETIPTLPIKRMSIRNHHTINEHLPERFCETLEELEISSWFPEDSYDSIFTTCSKLKLLKVHTDIYEPDSDFRLSGQTYSGLKTLIIHSKSSGAEKICRLIQKFPNVENFVLKIRDHMPTTSQLTTISNHQKKLRTLQIQTIDGQSTRGFSVPTLKELHIYVITRRLTRTGWNNICRGCPEVEKLSIGYVQGYTRFKVPQLKCIAQGLPNLQHFSIGFGFHATREIFETFKSDFPQLKTLTLMRDATCLDPSMINILSTTRIALRLLDDPIPPRVQFNLYPENDNDIHEFEGDTEGEDDESDDFPDRN